MLFCLMLFVQKGTHTRFTSGTKLYRRAVGINEKTINKVSIVSEASGPWGDKIKGNVIGGGKVRTDVTGIKLSEKRATYADKVRTGSQ